MVKPQLEAHNWTVELSSFRSKALMADRGNAKAEGTDRTLLAENKETAKYGTADGVTLEFRTQFSRQIHQAAPRSGLWGAADRLGNKLFPLGYWSEFREIAKLHLPAFLTCFFQFLLQTISVIMCGHLSKEQLDAVALACTLINVAALSIGLGLSTGCDTYFAQTFGSRHKKRVGLYLQRSLLVMYMFLVPVYCLHLNIKPVLLLLGQDPIISDMTARYILIFMPGVFFDYTFLVLARYLQTQNRVNPPLVCAVIGNVFNAVSQYVAIYVLGFEFEASAVCQAASLLVMCLCILAYIRVSRVFEDTWDGWKLEALYDIGGFVRLAVPGLLLVSLENISFEVGTFLAGSLNAVQLAAQAILFQSISLLYMVCIGMSIAVNIRVGQHLGAGSIEKAKHTCKVAVTMILVTSTIICVFFATCREQVASIFTSDPEVMSATVELLAVYAPYPYFDGLSATAAGVLKGSGQQLIGAAVNIVAYDFISLPIGIPLTLLTPLQMKGFWIAMLLGIILQSIVFWIIVWRTDWEKQAAAALSRASGQVVKQKPRRHVKKFTGKAEAEPLISSGQLAHVRSASRVYSTPYESDAELDVTQPPSLPPLRPVLMRRLATWLCLAVCLVLAIVLRSFQDRLVPLRWFQLCLPVGNSSEHSALRSNFTFCG